MYKIWINNLCVTVRKRNVHGIMIVFSDIGILEKESISNKTKGLVGNFNNSRQLYQILHKGDRF